MSDLIRITFIRLLFFIPLTLSIHVNAQEGQKRCKKTAAVLLSAEGEVVWQSEEDTAWTKASINTQFCYGDTIRVISERAALRLENETLVRLNHNTTIKLLTKRQSLWLEIVNGASHFLSRTPKRFNVKVKEPYINASIDGTEFSVTSAKGKSSLSVFEGQVTASTHTDKTVLISGEQASTVNGTLRKAKQIRLADAVAWSLNYPPIIVDEVIIDEKIKRQINAGAYHEALQYLSKQTQLSAAELNLKAALHLYTGDIQKSQNILIGAKKSAFTQALATLIHLVKGNFQSAIQLNDRQLREYPYNSSVLLTASYIEQSQFNLKSAYQLVKLALTRSKQEPLLWARKGELELILGKEKNARLSLNKAVELAPQLKRANILKGFDLLKQQKLTHARALFSEIKRQGPADPLAIFAHALVDIRLGKLKKGRAAIELACLLDPTNSLYRSYLGKAYLEEQRFAVAKEQFNLARRFDPNDPTPDFYEAVQLQTHNQPVAALGKLEDAMVKNNHRAVYRSRLLLDTDAAARAANLAEVYLDLDVPGQAQLTTGQALTKDPYEYSALRLLAEVLAEDAQADSARASAVLQARMNQPLLSTPIRSTLAEQDLLVVDGAGPSELGINEYNPVFNRNKHNAATGGIGGNDNTSAGDIYLSGLQNHFAYSLERYEYNTKGFDGDRDLNYTVSSAFIQAKPINHLNIFSEYTERTELRNNISDKSLRNLLDDDNNLFNKSTRRRAGALYSINANVDILATLSDVALLNTDKNTQIATPTPFLEITNKFTTTGKEDSSDAEALITYQNSYINLYAGLKKSQTDIESRLRAESISIFSNPVIPNLPPNRQTNLDTTLVIDDSDLTQHYLGVTYKYLNKLDLHLSVSSIDHDRMIQTEDLNANDNVSSESLAFSETLTSSSINIPISPSSKIIIAHQEFYALPNGISASLKPLNFALLNPDQVRWSETDSTSLAYNIDHKTFDFLFSYTKRDITIPTRQSTLASVSRLDTRDIEISSIYYWENIAISLTPTSQRIISDAKSISTPEIMRNLIVPLTLSAEFRNGLGFSVRHSYISQKLLVRTEADKEIFSSTKEQFGLINISADWLLLDNNKNRTRLSLQINNATDNRFNFFSPYFYDPSERRQDLLPRRTFLFSLNTLF